LVINPCLEEQAAPPGIDRQAANGNADLPPAENDANVTLEIFPNPFTGPVNITYELPGDCNTGASLYLLDITGKRLLLLDKTSAGQSGQFKLTFDARSLAPGVYFYELSSANCKLIKKGIKISNH
jgi:hypothetical protein